MEPKFIIESLHKMAPRRTFCLARSDWWMQYSDSAGEYLVKYNISVQPGFDGTLCQHFYGKTAEECYKAIVLAIAKWVNGSGEDRASVAPVAATV